MLLIDQQMKIRYNMSDKEFEEYIERVAICRGNNADNPELNQKHRDVINIAIKQILDGRRNENQM